MSVDGSRPTRLKKFQGRGKRVTWSHNCRCFFWFLLSWRDSAGTCFINKQTPTRSRVASCYLFGRFGVFGLECGWGWWWRVETSMIKVGIGSLNLSGRWRIFVAKLWPEVEMRVHLFAFAKLAAMFERWSTWTVIMCLWKWQMESASDLFVSFEE